MSKTVKESKSAVKSGVKEARIVRSKEETVDFGDFIRVEYTARIEDGSVFDTTSRRVAEENKIFDEHVKYGPRLDIVGSKWLLDKLEKKLVGMKEGEETTITLKPSEAFGERDPNLVKTYILRRFTKRNINPKPGMKVQLEGAVGTIKAVNAGRVIVDFNHPQAGHEVTYKVKIKEIIRSPNEKIKALFKEVFGVPPKKISLNNELVEVELPENILLSEDLLLKKLQFINYVKKYTPKYRKAKIIEVFKLGEKREGREKEGKK